MSGGNSGHGGDNGDEWWTRWGRWQARLALLLALPVLLTGAYSTNYVFLAAPTPHRCLIPECEGNVSGPLEDVWAAGWLQAAVPAGDQCRRWRPAGTACDPASFDTSATEPCAVFVYQHSTSIVPEFDLACQEWKRSLVGTVHNVGMLISLPIMGSVSDRWGRRAALVVSGSGVGVLGLLKSFVSSYYTYVGGELLETIFGASVYPAAFVLMLEWLGVKQRILASMVLGVPLALGGAGLALLDYVAGGWRSWARAAYPPSLLLLLYPWLLPESVRWLLARGQRDRAVATVRRAAACNRVAVDEDSLHRILAEGKRPDAAGQQEGLLTALVKYGRLRVRLAVCFVWWGGAVFVYYGLAANAHALAGSRHVNYAAIALVQLPALLANTLLLDRVGRRLLLTAALLLTSVSFISMSCLPDSSSTAVATWGRVLYVCGQVGATMSLNCLYVYTAELMPTRARHRLLGACSTCGRLGSILAPLTPLLGTIRPWLPTAVFGVVPLVSAALTRLLPDTLHAALPDDYADLADPPAHTERPPPVAV